MKERKWQIKKGKSFFSDYVGNEYRVTIQLSGINKPVFGIVEKVYTDRVVIKEGSNPNTIMFSAIASYSGRKH